MEQRVGIAGLSKDAMKTKQLFEEFLNYLRFERHFSPHTAKCYSADLKQYAEFLATCARGSEQPPGGGSFGPDQTVGTAVMSPPNADVPVLGVTPE